MELLKTLVNAEKKEKAVIIWSDGFPYKQTALNEKNSLIAKALILAGYDVYITSKVAYKEKLKNEGTVDSIHYRNFSIHQIRPYFVQYIFAIISETRYILSLREKYNCVYLVGSYIPITIYLYYSIFCKISGVHIVLSIMEWHIAAHDYLSIPKRINAFLFDKYASRLSKGTIAISELIISNLKNFSSNTKFLLIPALTDINKIDEVKKKEVEKFKYILYCGGIGYIEVIEIVIDAFQKLKDEIHLVLILHGENRQLEKLKNKIANNRLSNRIHIFCCLSYSNLIQFYKNASVLLVPLRDSMQDRARYPQKISEYAACARPIVSNAIGQVGLDFCHKTNIYFANSFTSTDLAEGITTVLQDENMAEIISKNAREKAELYFDYRNYGNKLDQFLMNL